MGPLETIEINGVQPDRRLRTSDSSWKFRQMHRDARSSQSLIARRIWS